MPISKELRQQVWARDNFTCQYCSAQQNLSLDHIVPRSKGGTDAIDNPTTACRSYNSAKNARPIETFKERLAQGRINRDGGQRRRRRREQNRCAIKIDLEGAMIKWQYRHGRKLTKRELGQAINVTESALSRMTTEPGQRWLDLPIIDRLCDALEVELTDILIREPNDPPLAKLDGEGGE